MGGTRLYAVKATPTHHDDAQSGAPVGQVIALVTGGLGVTGAWAGGYVVNATRSELRSIVSHIDAEITLEGALTNWVSTDDLDIYDAWDTVQGACDQLSVDQGTTKFTACQYIRIYTGTYTENVVMPSTLVQDLDTGAMPIIEGDPAADRSAVILAPVGGVSVLTLTMVYAGTVLVRHLTIAGTPTSTSITATFTQMFLSDLSITAPANGAVYTGAMISARDCEIVIPNGSFGLRGGIGVFAERCDIEIQTGGVASYAYALWGGHVVAHACVIYGYAGSDRVAITAAHCVIDNCVFYRCGRIIGTYYRNNPGRFLFRNCIVAACTQLLMFNPDPEETAARYGPHVTLRSNCYYGYTTFAHTGAGGALTYAQFCAYAHVDAHDDLDATDPLLADPAAGDFSLQLNSPCRHAGAGTGVVDGINGVEFDPHRPDVGCWSSGFVGGRAAGGVG